MNPMGLRFALQNCLRNRRRSLVTVLIAALGTAGILLAGGFALYTYESLAEAAARDTGHLVIATPDQFAREEDTPLQYGLEQFDALRQQLLADPQVRAVLPHVEFSGLISNGDRSVVMLGKGVEPDSEFSVKGPFLTVQQGEVLGAAAGAPEVMLGAALAANLKAVPGTGLTLLASTSNGALNAIDVRVRGIFSTGMPEIDKRMVYTDLRTAQKLIDSPRVSSLGVFLNRMEATPAAQARLQAALPKLEVRTWEQQAVFYQAVRGLYNRIFGALGLVIAVIVLFVVGNAMSMAIIERTRELGTLRALGTLPAQLQRMLALEGMLLGGAGALLGAAVSLAAALLLYSVELQMPPPPGRSVGYPLYVNVDAPLYLATMAAMVLLTLLASAWVARKTVRLPIPLALAHT